MNAPPTRPRYGAIDVVYRWCSPLRFSGDGAVIRSRDNRELTYSLTSIACFMPWVRHVHIVHAGAPPVLHQDPDFAYPTLEGRIFLHCEKRLMKRAIPHVGVKPRSRNSEPVKLAVPWIRGLSDRFVMLDDDYIVARRLSPDTFFDPDDGRPIYPRHIDGCHRPLPFDRALWANYVQSMSKRDRRRHYRSGQHRRDILPEMIRRQVRSGEALRRKEWVTIQANSPYQAFRRIGWRLFFGDWDGVAAFLGHRGKGLFNLLFTRAFLHTIERRGPTTICVNDNWDVGGRWYDRQVDVYREFMAEFLPQATDLATRSRSNADATDGPERARRVATDGPT